MSRSDPARDGDDMHEDRSTTEADAGRYAQRHAPDYTDRPTLADVTDPDEIRFERIRAERDAAARQAARERGEFVPAWEDRMDVSMLDFTLALAGVPQGVVCTREHVFQWPCPPQSPDREVGVAALRKSVSDRFEIDDSGAVVWLRSTGPMFPDGPSTW